MTDLYYIHKIINILIIAINTVLPVKGSILPKE